MSLKVIYLLNSPCVSHANTEQSFRRRALPSCVLCGEDGEIYVTGDEGTARLLQREGRCVIGYQDGRAGDRFFHGADEVITSLDALDIPYLEAVWRRFRRIPYTVARTARLEIRESVPDDFGTLYRIRLETENEPGGSSAFAGGTVRSRETDPGSGPDTGSSPDARNEPDLLREQVREQYLAYIGTAYRFFGFGLWTVLLRDTGQVIGRCGLSPQADDLSPEGRIEIGYVIGRKYRRKGYAQEACRAVLIFAFGEMELQEVFARIHERNIPSLRLAEKLGFRRMLRMDGGTELWRMETDRSGRTAGDGKPPDVR